MYSVRLGKLSNKVPQIILLVAMTLLLSINPFYNPIFYLNSKWRAKNSVTIVICVKFTNVRNTYLDINLVIHTKADNFA